MRRVVAICLIVMMIACLSITAFADPGAFVSSPSGNKAPRMIEFRALSEGCTGELAVTAYADRNTLEAEEKAAIEHAYDVIVACDDLTTLNADLASLAKAEKIEGEDLAVSDLFDISCVGCEATVHDTHKGFAIELEADTLKNFVGLLHLHDGVWELVEGTKVDGNVLSFEVDDLSPFAIVVDTDPAVPPTGDNSMVLVFGIVALISCGAMILCWTKYRKQAA